MPVALWTLRCALLILYFARPWSQSRVLSSIPNGHPLYFFDLHGAKLIVSWLSTTLLFIPLAWLLSGQGRKGLDHERKHRWFWPAAVTLVVGSPLLTQILYMRDLPMTLAWPVVVTSILWSCGVGVLAFAGGVRTPRDLGVRRNWFFDPLSAGALVFYILLAKIGVPLWVLTSR